MHKAHCSPDVGSLRPVSVSEGGALAEHALIPICTAELEVESAGKGSLGPAGVWALRQGPVAAGNGQRCNEATRSGGGKERREAGRKEVGEVVQPGGGPPKVFVRRP